MPLSRRRAMLGSMKTRQMTQMTQRAFERLTDYDTRAMVWVLGRPGAALAARAARLVSRLGDGPGYALLALLLWQLDYSWSAAAVATLALGFLFELPAYVLLKRVIQRPRPADAHAALSAFITPSDKFSFPSGHTAAAFMVALVMTAFVPALAPLCYGLASAIGLSRVLLGVHFPSDIVAGAALGSLMAALALLII